MLSDRVGAMSARPGRFMEIIATGWPRERDSTIVGEPAFGALTAGCGTTCAASRSSRSARRMSAGSAAGLAAE